MMMQAPMAHYATLENITQPSISVGSTQSNQNVNQGTTSSAQPNVSPQFAYFTQPSGSYGAQLPG